MVEQHAHGHPPVDAEFRQVLGGRVREVDPALLRQPHDQCGRERLADARDREGRVGLDLLAGLDVREPACAQPGRAIGKQDGHRHAGDAFADPETVEPTLERVAQDRRRRRQEPFADGPAEEVVGIDGQRGGRRAEDGHEHRQRRADDHDAPTPRGAASCGWLCGVPGAHAARADRRGAMTCARYPGRVAGTIGQMNPDRTASGLLRAIGLLPDGPVVWGRPLPPTGAGVFVVEVAAPLPAAPIELTRVGKWLERVEDLRVDGERPTSRALAARIGASWLPSEPVIFIGSSETSVSRKVAAMLATPLGDRRPSSSGHWLHALAMPAGTRVWWAATKAVEEYEDALFTAFAEGVADAERSALHDPASTLPFANLRRPTGERRKTGLTGSLLPEPVVAPAPPTRIVQVPDGDADGADGKPPVPRPRRPAAPRKASPTPVAVGATALEPAEEAGALTPDGAKRLQAELDGLINGRRPEVIAWIRSAKELGDLKENSDYHAARAEQSFLEGRIQAIEAGFGPP